MSWLGLICGLSIGLRLAGGLECHKGRVNSNVRENSPNCAGDLCAIWRSSIGAEIQGCLTGLGDSVKLGCRRNAVGATLCVCNSLLCNTAKYLQDQAALNTRLLPVLQCRNVRPAPFLTQAATTADTCQGNACFYSSNQVASYSGLQLTQVSADCSPLPDYTFDILIATLWPGPGALPGACYLLQTNAADSNTACMCDSELCNVGQPFPFDAALPQIECHLAQNEISDASLSPTTCHGQLCLVQKLSDAATGLARYNKGCLTVTNSTKTNNGPAMVPGYRNVLGVEQWICQEDRCNLNVAKAESTPLKMPLNSAPLMTPHLLSASLALLTLLCSRLL